MTTLQGPMVVHEPLNDSAASRSQNPEVVRAGDMGQDTIVVLFMDLLLYPTTCPIYNLDDDNAKCGITGG